MTTPYEPLTPVSVEARLSSVITDISNSQKDLREARITETRAQIAYRRAEITAGHDVPKVRRGEFTVDERKDQIAEKCIQAWQEFIQATTLREIAQDALRARLAEAEVLRSLGSSVRASYEMAGRG